MSLYAYDVDGGVCRRVINWCLVGKQTLVVCVNDVLSKRVVKLLMSLLPRFRSRPTRGPVVIIWIRSKIFAPCLCKEISDTALASRRARSWSANTQIGLIPAVLLVGVRSTSTHRYLSDVGSSAAASWAWYRFGFRSCWLPFVLKELWLGNLWLNCLLNQWLGSFSVNTWTAHSLGKLRWKPPWSNGLASLESWRFWRPSSFVTLMPVVSERIVQGARPWRLFRLLIALFSFLSLTVLALCFAATPRWV